MLGAAFFHMMPEAVRLGSAGDAALVGGRAAGAVLPRAVLRLPPPRGARPTRPSPARRTRTSTPAAGATRRAWSTPRRPAGAGAATKGTSLHWGAAAFGLAAHSLAGGVALASAAAADAEVRARPRARRPGGSSSPRSSTSRPTP